MFMKVVLILSVTYLVTSYQVSYSEKLGDNVDDLLKNLKETLDNAINEGNTNISSAKNVLIKKVAFIQGQLQTVFDTRNVTLENNLRDVKDFAANYPVKIDDCLENKDAKIANFTAKGFKDYTECVNPYVHNITFKAEDAYGKLQILYFKFTNDKKEVERCRKITESTSCLAKISSKINEDIINAPTSVQDITKVVTDYANNKLENIVLCGDVQDVRNDMNAVILFNKITECILQKINNKY